jgi:RNA polymerase sigma-70 factor (ECF subfamily)
VSATSSEARWLPSGSVQRTPDFGEIVRDHASALRARALWLTRNQSDAADLFQDTIERAMCAKRQNVGAGAWLRWLLTIMHNLFLDGRRAAAVRRFARNADALIERAASVEEEPAELWRTIDDAVVDALIRELPPSMSEMLLMFARGASYSDLSAHFGIPSSTVGTRLMRIRRRLRARLEQGESAPQTRPSRKTSGKKPTSVRCYAAPVIRISQTATPSSQQHRHYRGVRP